MARKFSELSQTEQIYFQSIVDAMRNTWNEDIEVKMGVVQRLDLDTSDPIVFKFLTDVYVPPPRTDLKYIEPSPIPATPPQQQSPSTPQAEKQVKETKSRDMTYAHSEDLIVIQNRLLHAISHLTLNERRLILFLSPIVRKQTETDPTNRVFYVYVQDFINEYNLKGKYLYTELEKIADSILDKNFFFWYKTKNSKIKKGVNWVSECDYLKKEGALKIKLDTTVIEMLTIFDKTTGNFWTQYQKEWVASLGTYGIIMLEMVLSSAETKGYYTIEHLREKFNCVDNYEKFADFRIWVIDKAIKEIEQSTPIKIQYEQHKQGRAVHGLTFRHIDTSIKAVKDKEKNEQESKETNPFVNFKMTQKQLALFASKIKKVTNQDVDEIISELSNVHLQGQHINSLKLLDYVPSDWYSDDEIKNHPTPEQIEQAKIDNANKEKQEQKQTKRQLENDYEKILSNAEIFVKANIARIGKVGIETMYLKNENYTGIIEVWKCDLLDKNARKTFKMLDEILGE